MTDALAAGLAHGHVVAAVGVRRGEHGGHAGGLPARPLPLRIPDWAFYSKDDVFSLCDSLARAEQALVRAGEPQEAARVAAALELVEAGLA